MPHVDVLLFVGVAVAWALYLIPKAVQRHEQASRAHTVDRFSHRMRVLARREPVSTRDAELVVPSARAAAAPALGAVSSAAPRPWHDAARVEVLADQARRQREASRRATRRRRRVLGLLLVALAAVAGVAAYGVIEWAYVAIPGGLLLAWLVACRVMVKGETRARRAVRGSSPVDEPAAAKQALDMDETTEIARVVDAEPGMWDPVPVTLPTYVDKPAATRSVHGIDLESDGVWTSGRTQADTALARRADADAAAARAVREVDDAQRAAGAAG